MNLNYTGNIPNPPNNPSSDVPLMQTNTNSIESWASVDHFGYNNNAGGWHQFVHLINTTAPSLSSGSATANGALYSNSNNPYWVNASGSNQLAFLGTSSIVANGYVRLGGVLFQWGNFNPNVNTAVNFPTPFANVFTVLMTQSISNNSTFRQASVATGTLTPTGFTYQGTVDSHINPVYFFAVGN